MTMTSLERVRATLSGNPVDRPPAWCMRQAGRTLPEYRAIRAQHSFNTVMRTPDLATEVTLQPLRRFDFDVAILFSDILTIPEALGIPFELVKGKGPVLERTVRSMADVDALRTADIENDLDYVFTTLRQLRAELGDTKGLFGFSGAPFTLAVYMVEGGPTKSFSKIKGLMFGAPDVFAALMTRISDAVIPYLKAQLEAGADAVQLFDTWAGELAEADYRTHVLPHTQRILAALKPHGTILSYIKNGAHLLDAQLDGDAHGISLDWRVDMGRAVDAICARPGPRQIVQGNVEPMGLFGPADSIAARVRAVHDAVGGRTGHVFNLGHGLAPDTPIAGIQAFADAVFALAD